MYVPMYVAARIYELTYKIADTSASFVINGGALFDTMKRTLGIRCGIKNK